MSSRKNGLLPYILTFAGVCLIALGYVAMWIVNIAMFGRGFSNSFIIKTTLGKILASVVFSVILAAAVFAIVYAIRLYLKKDHPAISLHKMSLFPRVLSIFAIFSCLDAFFMFFYAILFNSVVGISHDNNFQVIGKILDFAGYYNLGVTTAVKGMPDSILAIISTVLFGLSLVAFCAFAFYVFIRVRTYMNVLSNTYAGAQYDRDNKPPFIVSFVMAGLYLALAIVSLIAGVWVDAIIQLGTALFLGAGAWMFMNIHKELRSTSVE